VNATDDPTDAMDPVQGELPFADDN